jgi:hypothetical protein
MIKCLVYDNSIRFSRTVYGVMTITAFLLHNFWLVLATSILMFIGAFSENYNIFYRIHLFLTKKFSRKEVVAVAKESGEMSFACGMGGSLLLLGFFLLYFSDQASLAWGLVLVTSVFMFLAGFGGICTASIMYASFKKIFKNGKTKEKKD